MKWMLWKDFTIDELYEVLKLRSEIFVVEQECPYQDLDDLDQDALHLTYREKGKLIGYLRLLFPKENMIKIGRVVVEKEHRHLGIATKLLKESLQWIKENREEKEILLSAQVYATKLYSNLGFQKEGESYLEDGIPHIEMKKDIV
ncbi:MAG: GNAT family N-acetyltransferase [Tissierellia bacterium]|nr:GNAT family N-acetyltransferase [Tissierellia bacterium]